MIVIIAKQPGSGTATILKLSKRSELTLPPWDPVKVARKVKLLAALTAPNDEKSTVWLFAPMAMGVVDASTNGPASALYDHLIAVGAEFRSGPFVRNKS